MSSWAISFTKLGSSLFRTFRVLGLWNDVWVSAYFPHPLRLNQVVHASWREERQGGASASPPPGFFRLPLSPGMVQRPPPQQQLKRVPAEAAVAGGRLPTKTSTTGVSACPHRGSRPATAVAAPGRSCACDPTCRTATWDPVASSLGRRQRTRLFLSGGMPASAPR